MTDAEANEIVEKGLHVAQYLQVVALTAIYSLIVAAVVTGGLAFAVCLFVRFFGEPWWLS